MKYLISSNGSINNYKEINKNIYGCDRVISVDGGIRHLRKLKIKPDIAIGDFDSIHPSDMKYLQKNCANIIEFDTNKDFTDSEISINYAIDNGATEIDIIGFKGSRLDHTLSNIFILKKINPDIKCRLIDENNIIYCLKNELTFSSQIGQYISILPLSKKVVVKSSSGLKYPLNKLKLKFGSSLSISNEAISSNVYISLKKGTALVFKSRD